MQSLTFTTYKKYLQDLKWLSYLRNGVLHITFWSKIKLQYPIT